MATRSVDFIKADLKNAYSRREVARAEANRAMGNVVKATADIARLIEELAEARFGSMTRMGERR